jgi:uncharacterized membrane protein (DUF373 family)
MKILLVNERDDLLRTYLMFLAFVASKVVVIVRSDRHRFVKMVNNNSLPFHNFGVIFTITLNLFILIEIFWALSSVMSHRWYILLFEPFSELL